MSGIEKAGQNSGRSGISFEGLKEDYQKTAKIATQMSQNILNNCGNYLNGSMSVPQSSASVSTSAAGI